MTENINPTFVIRDEAIDTGTPTPRTDAFQRDQQDQEIREKGIRDDTCSLVNIDSLNFARTLERELAEARAEREERAQDEAEGAGETTVSYCENCPCKSCKTLRASLKKVDAWFAKANAQQLAARRDARKTEPAGNCKECRREDLPCDLSCAYWALDG